MDERMLNTGPTPVGAQLDRLPAAGNTERELTLASLSLLPQTERNTNYFSGQEQGTGRGRGRGGRVGETACRNGHVVYPQTPTRSLFFFSLCNPLPVLYLTSHRSIITAFANFISSPWLIDVSYHLCIGCLFRKQALFFIVLYPGVSLSLSLSLYTLQYGSHLFFLPRNLLPSLSPWTKTWASLPTFKQ